jgi:DNA-directed RNA polymerase subunit RPC12/RpoP
MRLPLTKVYRAFPELDRFTDEQCREYVKHVHLRFPWSRWMYAALANVVAFVVAALAFWSVAWVTLRPSVTMMPGFRFVDHPLMCSALLAALSLGPASLLRYWIRHRWLRRRLRECIAEARCANCRYPLLGLAVRDGAVLCPECGERVVLADFGLTPADLLGAAPPSPAPAGVH